MAPHRPVYFLFNAWSFALVGGCDILQALAELGSNGGLAGEDWWADEQIKVLAMIAKVQQLWVQSLTAKE